MNAPESSMMKSQSDMSNTSLQNRLASRNNNNSFTFLIDQITQYIQIPKILFYLCDLIIFLQILQVSFWVQEESIWTNSEASSVFSDILYYIGCFGSPKITSSSALIYFLVFLIATILVLASLIAQIICYKIRRRYFKKTLYPTRFMLELFPTIFILPLANYVGKLFKKLFDDDISKAEVIVFLIIAVCCLIFMAAISYFVNIYIGSSIYLPTSPNSAFDLKPYIYIMIINPFFSTCGYVFSYFPNWLLLVLIVVHIIFVSYFVAEFFRYRPFISMSMNSFYSCALLASGILDLLRFVTFFFDDASGIIAIVMFFVAIIIAAIVPNVFYKYQTKMMYRNLLINPEIPDYIPTDDERKEHFIDLRLDQDEKKALIYYNFIIANYIISYLDFFMPKFICNYHRTVTALAHCIKIMSFFPPQIRSLNILYNDMIHHSNLSKTQHFLLYQIQKLKMARQSSSSSHALDRLKEIKAATRELEASVIGFWSLPSCSIEYAGVVSKKLTKTKALWEEAINDFPNSSVYREEYIRFFIECETNFSEAILQRHMIDLIETGKNFSIDHCFRQFARNFPSYLKKGIVDMKGNFKKIGRRPGGGGSASSSQDDQSKNSSSCNSSTSSISLDMQVEEGIGKSIVTNARIRLALQRTTEAKKANAYGSYMLITWFIFVAGVAVFIFILINFNGYFDQRQIRASRLRNLVNSRLYINSVGVATLYNWGNRTKAINFKDEIISKYSETDDPSTKTLFSLEDSWGKQSVYFSVLARDVFDEYVKQIADISKEGTDVYYYMSRLLEESTELGYCDHTEIFVAEEKPQNLKTIMSYLEMIPTLLLTESDVENWFFNSFRLCSTLSTFQFLPTAFSELMDTMTEMATRNTQIAADLVILLQKVLPAVYGGISILLFIFVCVRYILEINKVISLLLKLPSSVKKESENPLRKDANDDKSKDSDNNISGFNVPVISCILIVVIYAVIIFMIFYHLQEIKHYNTQYEYLNIWTSKSEVRKSILIEICLYVTELIINNNPLAKGNRFLNSTEIGISITTAFDILETYTEELMGSSDGTPSIAGVNEDIDKLLLKEECQPNSQDASYHEMYRCGSAQQLQNFYMNTVSTVEVNLESYQGVIDDEIPITIFHLASDHLIPKLEEIDSHFSDMVASYASSYFREHVIFFVIEIILMLFLIILEMFNIRYLTRCYNVVLIQMRRVPPASLVADTDIVNYMLDVSKHENSGEMSTDQGIIHNTAACVLCIDNNMIIEIMNPAVTKTFGYSPEQMLGQSILTMLQNDAQNAIDTQLHLMLNKQSGMTFDGHTVCLSDNDTPMPCEITILAMTDSSDSITSFVVLLRDESLLLQQQDEAEKAKKQSEQLLYQILPRAIVVRLNQGEKDISFTVASATVMFADIVKFSEYAASLTPQEIMGNLSLLFAGFDEAIEKYETLIKIKLIGDVYMCAGGLFCVDEPPVIHCEEMIKFAIECLQVLEETNVKLNAVLNVRIGVNTGGPLIAGVLGTDKPTFDIIGDPINVASRLQSTDIAGKIQISEQSYELIKENDFQVEPRGEVYLKGKGNQMAYLVSATSTHLPGIDSYIHDNNYE
ncbi:Adenylate and Guanylate cyclase catalytic domain containing protein [Tritrichomonas foetus]|uniref:Adenylate and Guanylate cyclase catalytic domain containing protein n=1 Tax=Tritrichomonas foetus TaxID=1144522 RepID=A0A1J4KDW4_9EUKA|nr:Adenylate and Guanylate cyclase catalytic domain containing protein [Tritrichomonas foetus]|eukprot:OHT09625.1 Adenylate and Guanylate cyclase catalytic domain containing protein [Tritrichomonas foetus]